MFHRFGDLEKCALRPGNVHSAHNCRDVLEPVIIRYRDKNLGRHFRADAAFTMPQVYNFLESEGFSYAIGLPANRMLQQRIAHLLRRPVGRPPKEARTYHTSFIYQVASWTRPLRLVTKVEWHPGGFYPRIDFI